MNCEKLKGFFPEYWDGTLDAADRLILEAHLERCADCREEAERLRRLWTDLDELNVDVKPSDGMRDQFYQRLEAYRLGSAERVVTMPRSRPAPSWIMAAGIAAALVAGFFGGYLVDARRDSGQFAQLRGEVNSMRQLVALSLLQQQNASDRLQGVNWAYRVQRSDTEVLAALLEAVNHDSNVNVRMAAVDALKTFSDSPVARRGMAQALARQESPMVQMALIDQLSGLKEAGAIAPLRALAADAKADSAVRERAGMAANQLGSRMQ